MLSEIPFLFFMSLSSLIFLYLSFPPLSLCKFAPLHFFKFFKNFIVFLLFVFVICTSYFLTPNSYLPLYLFFVFDFCFCFSNFYFSVRNFFVASYCFILYVSNCFSSVGILFLSLTAYWVPLIYLFLPWIFLSISSLAHRSWLDQYQLPLFVYCTLYSSLITRRAYKITSIVQFSFQCIVYILPIKYILLYPVKLYDGLSKNGFLSRKMKW